MDTNIDQIISRHLAREATAKEQLQLRQWLRASQTNRDEFQRISVVYQFTASKPDEAHRSEIFSKLNQRIRNEHVELGLNQIHKTTRIRYFMSIAAILTMLLAASAVFFLVNRETTPERGTLHQLIVKTNPAGQKLKIFLPDGSIAWLNSESELTYQKEFSDSNRIITLQGEAYFEVIKDAERPFIVNTGNISTTALGTSFNIEAFDTTKITVSLTRGMVNVATNRPDDNDSYVQLRPGEGALYDANSDNSFHKIAIDIAAVRHWKDGILELKNASLDETISTLERWYGVNITIENSSAKPWEANGFFDNEYLENVLNSLGFSQGFEFTIRGNNISITFK